MKSAQPLSDVPSNAKTIELSEEEVLAALCAFVGKKLGQSFPAIAELSVIVYPKRQMRFVLSYWPEAEPDGG